MKFIVDTHLPPKLAFYLTQKGYESIHTTYYHFGHLLNDIEILDKAVKNNFIVISKDNDFLNFYQTGLIPPPKVLLLEIGNTTNTVLMNYFDVWLNSMIKLLVENSLVICDVRQIFAFK